MKVPHSQRCSSLRKVYWHSGDSNAARLRLPKKVGPTTLYGMSRRRSRWDFGKRFIHLHDLDFVAQFGPAAKHLRIFLRGAAGVLGLPVAHENIVLLAV